jgi:hypothetical protein
MPRNNHAHALALVWLILTSAVPAAQEHQHPEPTAEPAWRWSWAANAFAGWNYQVRKFRDFQRVESQNWLMGAGERTLGGGDLRLHGMLSLEAFTMQAIGSPQVFQTGEMYGGAPLIDYQHPHDLFMNLSAAWRRPIGDVRTFIRVGLVDAPAIGPDAFMHRPSAGENPTAPLGHHQLDATHITHGAVTAGVVRGTVTLEGSWFRGAEPDEHRTDLDLGALDSAAGRLSWRRRGWEAQVSAAHLTTPEAANPFSDVVRLTASAGYTEPGGRWAALAAWGQNREVDGNLDAYLIEATVRPHGRHAWYGRAELVTKDILNAGATHLPGAAHFHPLSRVGAFTVGYVRDVLQSGWGHLGIGGDVTGYTVPDNLKESYGAPVSFHVFFRYRPAREHDVHTRH